MDMVLLKGQAKGLAHSLVECGGFYGGRMRALFLTVVTKGVSAAILYLLSILACPSSVQTCMQ